MLPYLCDAYGLMVARGIHDDAWAWLSTRRTPGSDVEAYGGAATHSRGCLREWGGRFLGGDAEGQPRELLSMHEGGPEARITCVLRILSERNKGSSGDFPDDSTPSKFRF
jgi:hypothetical protein